MAAITAEGGITLAEDYLRAMLANCPRWQTMCRCPGNETPAADRTYRDMLPPPANDQAEHSRDELVGYRPFALVWTDENAGYRKARVGTDCYAESGVLNIQIEVNVDEADANDPGKFAGLFKNDLGTLIDELCERAYQPGYIAFDEIHLRGPWRVQLEETPQQGDHLFASLSMSWGVQQ